MSITNFRLHPDDFGTIGANLSRPECIVALPDGRLFVADDRGGVTRLLPDGRQDLIGAIPGLPNGLAMERSGSLLVAEIERGILYRLHPDGGSEVVLDAWRDDRLGAVNFVYIDHQDRVWVTVSTRLEPRRPAAATPTFDGYIMLLDGSGSAEVAADSLCFANEVRVDPEGRYLYVAETALRRISRFEISGDSRLTGKTTYGPPDIGGRPDGIALDAEGNLWLTEVDNNAICVITPDQQLHRVYEDPDARVLNFPASLTFAGPDLKTVIVGSLRMDRLPCFRSPIAGSPMSHWNT